MTTIDAKTKEKSLECASVIETNQVIFVPMKTVSTSK